MARQDFSSAKAYIEGMLWAAFGVKCTSDSLYEWQIDAVKECATKLKESAIEHLPLSSSEKDELKRQWKQWLGDATKGFVEVLKREGRLLK